MSARKNFESPWVRPRLATFAEIWAFVPIDPTNVRTKFEVRNFVALRLPIPEIIGVLKNRQSLNTPTLPFLTNFSWAFVRMNPVNVSAKFVVRNFTRSWDNSDYLPFERALATSYRLSIVTFPLSLRVSEILPLLCSSRHFSAPHLAPLVSPKFPHVPLGLGLGRWPFRIRI